MGGERFADQVDIGGEHVLGVALQVGADPFVGAHGQPVDNAGELVGGAAPLLVEPCPHPLLSCHSRTARAPMTAAVARGAVSAGDEGGGVTHLPARRPE